MSIFARFPAVPPAGVDVRGLATQRPTLGPEYFSSPRAGKGIGSGEPSGAGHAFRLEPADEQPRQARGAEAGEVADLRLQPRQSMRRTPRSRRRWTPTRAG